MRKKWGPLIGGILIGFILVAMNFKYVVTRDEVMTKGSIVYEIKKDKPLTGYLETYYEGTDQIESSEHYKKGLLDGKSIFYFENGKVYKKGKNKKGELKGTWKFYNEDGKLVKKIKY